MNQAKQLATQQPDTHRASLPRSVGQWIMAVLLLLYPVAIWWMLPRWGSGPLLAIGIVMLSLRAWKSGQWLLHGVIALPLVALVLLGEHELGLRCYPVIVNLSMLWLFASSLRTSMPLIERLARLKEPQLPPAGVRYTRRVTQVWSLFFALNTLASLWTAIYADLSTWTLYNGMMTYVLTATVMAIEFIVRQYVRRRAST
ncbi:COG4648 family protein [Phytohalomonas tamaricis]|uniref:COG4648 family protein n=1 Tax=Phytohalomonas tamaricis TaxID=2081032 RepID=UPI0021D401AF|nr:hypothetical protein [Phytohalomonas tamaricis]